MKSIEIDGQRVKMQVVTNHFYYSGTQRDKIVSEPSHPHTTSNCNYNLEAHMVLCWSMMLLTESHLMG